MKKKIIISLVILFIIALASFIIMIVKQSKMYEQDYGMIINGPSLVCHGYEYRHKIECSSGNIGCVYRIYCIGFLNLE